MRIGIAAITSTALVGGTLVAVPAHPLLPVTAIAQAQENLASQAITAKDIATARALGIDLDLLDLEVLDAIEAEDAWPNRSGDEDNSLTLDALQALQIELTGGLSIPLVKTDQGGLLDLGGNGVGLLGAAADAPGTTGITASAGTLAQDGSLQLDPSLNQGTGPTKLDVLALTDQLGLNPAVSALIQELNLEIGALGSQIEKSGDTYTSDYTIADLNLVLESTAVADIAAVLNDVGATLDSTVSGLAGDAGVVNSITGALGPLTQTLGLGTPQVTLDTDLEGTVQGLIGGEIYDGQSTGGSIEDALVVLDLGAGTIRVNLENLHQEGLNDLPANTELNTAQLTLITDTVNELVQELLDRVEAAVRDGLNDTEVFVSIGVDTSGRGSGIITWLTGVVGDPLDYLADFISNPITGIFEIIQALIGGLVGGIEIEGTLGGLLGDPDHAPVRVEAAGNTPGLLTAILAPVLDLVVNDVISPLGQAVQQLLFDELDDVLNAALAAGPVNELLDGLSPLLDTVLSDVLLITLNKQDNLTIAGQPGLKVTALDVQVLPVVGTTPLAQLGLAASQVSGPITADLNNFAPEISVVPDEGPFGEPNTVEIQGNNLVYVGDDNIPVSLVTELTFGDVVVPAGDLTPNADGSLTVEVPVATADADEDRRDVTVTLTTGGGSDTDAYAYVAEADPIDVVTLAPIDNKTAEVNQQITPFGFEVTPDNAIVAVEGLPAGITYDATTGLVSGTPTAVTDTPATVTVTANFGTATPVTQTFSFTVTAAEVVTPTIGGIDDQTVTVGENIDEITPVATPDEAVIAVDGLPDGVTFTGGVISGAPTAAGSADVTVTATNAGVTASTSFTITTNPVAGPDAPNIADIDDQTITVGEAIAPITPDATPDDTDIEVEGLPAGVTFAGGVISGIPAAVGTSVVTVSATNATGSSSTTFQITVEAAEVVTPTIGAIDDQTVTVGEAIAPITPVVTPDDAAVEVIGLPDGVTFTGGVISGAPTTVGEALITVTATVGTAVATTTFTITTNPAAVEDAPVITPIDDQDGVVGEEIDPIDVVVTPGDSDVEVEGLPDGLDYNPDTGIIDGTPAEGTEGTHVVTITATNDGIVVIETFVITITDGITPVPPVDNGSANGSSEFLQQCLDSPAAGLVGLLVALGAVSAIAGPALEPLLKSIGGEIDRQLRNMASATAGAHQPEWVRNINQGLNDAANAVNHQMVSNALFASAALALVSAPILCGTDNNSSSSS